METFHQKIFILFFSLFKKDVVLRYVLYTIYPIWRFETYFTFLDIFSVVFYVLVYTIPLA